VSGDVRRPSVLIYDVNETLSDLRPLAGAFEAVGLPPGDVQAWFASVLRDGFALTITGDSPRFADVAKDALRIRIERSLATDDVTGVTAERSVTAVMEAFASLPLHADVVEGVRAVHRLGIRQVTLSNGAVSVAEGLLDRAGLTPEFDQLLSVADAPAWKPHADAYRFALRACGVSASEAMLVAVHPWDLHGAASAGLRTAWVNRDGAGYPSSFAAPEVEVGGLDALAGLLT
jgi:2-haloacid dehalogenase